MLCPYVALDHAVTMTPASYTPRLGTPLYNQAAVVLGTGNSASEIRRAFAVSSQSAIRTSQGAQLGGFSN